MPVSLGFFAFSLGAGVAATNAVIAGATAIGGILGSTLGQIGISIGLSALASTLRPSAPSVSRSANPVASSSIVAQIPTPTPEDVQQSVRQTTQPRVKHYGRVKVGGPWAFAEAKQGVFYKVQAIGIGPIDAIEEYWIDDTQVTLTGTGIVATAPWVDKARIKSRLGETTETYYDNLGLEFPEWTSAHRGDGVASLFATQYAVDDSEYLDTFPAGINTNYRVVIRGAKLVPFGGGTPAWDDNAAAVIYDYLRSGDGMRLPAAVLDTADALAGWTTAFNHAGEAVALAAGGSEERYRLWGSHTLDERPADILGRMLAACDGRLKPTPDGGLTLDIGAWSEPTVTIDESVILGFSDVARGRDVRNTANTIRATYLEPGSDYQTADADPWVDAADVAARGEISADVAIDMSPSHTQARRLMKLAYYRANPNWIGTFECNLKALAAIDQRFVRVTYPAFGIDGVFEVQDIRFNLDNDATLTSLTLTLQAMPETAYSWTAAQEEGDAPVSDSVTVDNSVPDPTDFNVIMADTVIGGSTVPYANLSFDAPPSPSLKTEARGKKTSDGSWTSISVGSGATSASSFVLEDLARYEFQIRHVTVGLREGSWLPSIEMDALTTAGAPAIATSVSGSGGSGKANVYFTSPADANYAGQNIYRNTTNDEGGAVLVKRFFGEQSTAEGWTDTGLAAGDYYYWLKSRNTLDQESASVATGSVTVT